MDEPKDPWRDMPSDSPHAAEPAKVCGWCSTPVTPEMTQCPGCGVSLTETEDLGLPLPGVTQVDPQVIASEAAARKRLEIAKNPAPHVVGRTLGGLGGGVFGALIGEAIESALVSKATDMAAGPRPVNSTNLRELDARLARPSEAFGDIETMAEAAEQPLAPGQLSDPWTDLPASNPALDAADPWAEPGTLTAAPNTTPTWPGSHQPVPNQLSEPGQANVYDPWNTSGGPWSTDVWVDDSGQGSADNGGKPRK
jgi:hypothetical protein